MRLSEWRKRAPSKDSVSPRVQAVVDPALGMLGAPGDPDCWVVWGDDPGVRYMILAPTKSGRHTADHLEHERVLHEQQSNRVSQDHLDQERLNHEREGQRTQ